MVSSGIPTLGDLGAALRRHRLAAGLTQAQLAGRAGVSRQWVSEVEGGKRAGVEFGAVLDVAGALAKTCEELPRATFISAFTSPKMTTPA